VGKKKAALGSRCEICDWGGAITDSVRGGEKKVRLGITLGRRVPRRRKAGKVFLILRAFAKVGEENDRSI